MIICKRCKSSNVVSSENEDNLSLHCLCFDCGYTFSEERRPTKRTPDGATRAAQKGSINGKRSAKSPRR